MLEAVWDYCNPYEWMERTARSKMPPLMIQAAITGGIHGKETNPNLPESIEEQVEAACEAFQAGAVAVHVHVRDPENQTIQTKNPDDYSKLNEMIRKRCPEMIVNNSTGGMGDLTIREKLAPLFAECKPDIVSLNPGPFVGVQKYKERLEPLPNPRPEKLVDFIMPITYDDVYETAKLCIEKKVKPEIEIFHPGHFWIVNDLINKKLIGPPYILQLVMGFPTGTYPTPNNFLASVTEMPKGSIFFGPGMGPYQLPVNVLSMIMGGHVRVGLEDNVYYKKGELAKNSAQQVERIIRIAGEMNRTIATVEEARQMLGLSTN